MVFYDDHHFSPFLFLLPACLYFTKINILKISREPNTFQIQNSFMKKKIRKTVDCTDREPVYSPPRFDETKVKLL